MSTGARIATIAFCGLLVLLCLIGAWVPLVLLVLAAAAVTLVGTAFPTSPAQLSPVGERRWGIIALRYLLAIAAVGAAMVLRSRLVAEVGPLPYYITFYPAVLLVASLGGGGPGIVATALSALAVDYWVLQPVGRLGIAATNDAVAMAIFIASSAFLSVLAERLRRARWAEAISAAQEQQIEELTRLNEELNCQSEELSQQSEELNQQNEELQSQSEEIQTLNTELVQREDMLQKLLDAARLSQGEQAVLVEICRAGLELFGRDAAAVAVIERKDSRLVFRAHAGLPDVELPVRPIQGTFAELVLEANKTASVVDTSLREDLSVLSVPGVAPFASVIASPMVDAHGPFGLVAVYSHQKQQWTAVHFRLAEWLAARCAQILETLRLQAQLRRHAALIDLSPDAIIVRRLDGTIDFWSDGACALYGWTREEALGRRTHELFQTVFAEPLERVDEQLRRTGRWTGELTHRTKQGRDVVVQSWWLAQLDEKGAIAEILESNVDVTEMQAARAAAEQAAEQRRLALEAAEIGAWEFLFEADRGLWDDRCHEIFGLPKGSLIDYANSLACMHPDDRSRVDEAVKKALAGNDGGVYDCEYRVVWPDGSLHWVASHGRVYFRGEGADRRPVRFLGVSMEITRRKQAEEELSLAKQAAEAANEAKSQFLANMSHEIRTPMTAVLGFTELLVQPGVSPEEQREFVEIIQRSGKNLLQLIDDILDLSKIEAGKIRVEPVDCSPRDLVEEVLSLVRLRAEAKQLALETRYHDPLPAAVRTDPVRLRQILVNLVGNAVKFTAKGSVRVAVSHRDEGPSPRLVFAISDTGIGISRQHIDEIFRPFNQADASLTRRFGGTGLGLAISRRLASLLGGAITVHSEPGKGSTFTLSIQVGRVVCAVAGSPPQEKRAGQGTKTPVLSGRVLLVEDTPANQHLVKTILSRAGLEVELADSGEEGCQAARQSLAEERPFDIILMDVQMPGISGFEATQRLRQQGWQRPIVAITAHAMEGDREKCLEAGCDDYLAKPILREDLLALVARHLRCC